MSDRVSEDEINAELSLAAKRMEAASWGDMSNLLAEADTPGCFTKHPIPQHGWSKFANEYAVYRHDNPRCILADTEERATTPEDIERARPCGVCRG